MNLDEATARIHQAFAEPMAKEYQEWLETTDYDLEMGSMVKFLVFKDAWKDDFSRFENKTSRLVNSHLLWKVSWYTAKLFTNSPTPAQVKVVYENAFGKMPDSRAEPKKGFS
jgi:hypothetical protein